MHSGLAGFSNLTHTHTQPGQGQKPGWVTQTHVIHYPGLAHWRAVKHVFHYLRGTAEVRLVYCRDAFDAQQLFSAFVDADNAGNPDNGCSTGGYALLIAGGAASWSSRLQNITAQLMTEAEYVAAVDAGKDVVWITPLQICLLSHVTSPRIPP